MSYCYPFKLCINNFHFIFYDPYDSRPHFYSSLKIIYSVEGNDKKLERRKLNFLIPTKKFRFNIITNKHDLNDYGIYRYTLLKIIKRTSKKKGEKILRDSHRHKMGSIHILKRIAGNNKQKNQVVNLNAFN